MISGETFPKESRILKTGDFRRAYSRGAPFRRGALVLHSVRNGLDRNRVGLSISARNIKLARRRNTIKRLLREIYRKNNKALKTGFDLILVIKRDGTNIVYKNLEKLFMDLTKDAGLR